MVEQVPRTARHGRLTLIIEFLIIIGLFITIQAEGLGCKVFDYNDALTLLSASDRYGPFIELLSEKPLAEVNAGFFQNLLRPQEGFPDPAASFTGMMNHDIHPLLFFLLIRYWHRLVGLDVVRLSILPVFFAGLAVVALFYAGRKMTGEPGAFFVSIYMALSILILTLSLQIRQYSLLALISIAAFYMTHQFMEDPERLKKRRRWTLFGITLAAGLYTQYVFIFLVLGLNLAFLTKIGSLNRPRLSQWLKPQLLAAFLFLPWLPGLFTQYLTQQQWGQPVRLAIPLGMRALELYFHFFLTVKKLYSIPYLIIVVLTLAGYLSLRRRLISRLHVFVVGSVFGFHFLLIHLEIINLSHADRLSYLITALPAIYLIVASGLQGLKRLHLGLILGSLLTIFIGLNTMSFIQTCSQHKGPGLSQTPLKNSSLGAFINGNLENNDVVLMDTSQPGALFSLAYYLRPEQTMWCGDPKEVAGKIKYRLKESDPLKIFYLHSTDRPGDDATRDEILGYMSGLYNINYVPVKDDKWHIFLLVRKKPVPFNLRQGL